MEGLGAPIGVARLDELRGRLAGLSRLLGTVEEAPAARPAQPAPLLAPRPASPPRPAARQQGGSRKNGPAAAPPFKATTPPSKSILRATNQAQLGSSVGVPYASFKEEEGRWLAQKGELQLLLNKEKKKRVALEAELKRVQDMLQFRVGEVKHLKAAMKQRDGTIAELNDRVRELELANSEDKVAQEAVQQAQAERDELRGAMQEMLQKLAHTNDIMAHTDQTIAAMEAKVHAMDAERSEALQQAAAAAEEAVALRQAAAELEWKCSMLQQLADMTLQQNEEKMCALRELLQAESQLGAEDDDELLGSEEGEAAACTLPSVLNLSDSGTDSSGASPSIGGVDAEP